MEKQKTAIEFLMMVLQEEFPKQMRDIYESNQLLAEQIAIQAKQMEKEQLDNFFNQGYTQGMIEDLPEKSRPRFKNSEQYYESKYGKDE